MVQATRRAEFGFQFGGEVYFHAFQATRKPGARQHRTGKRQDSSPSGDRNVVALRSQTRGCRSPLIRNRSEHFQTKMSSWPFGLWNSLRALWISARSTVPL